MRFYNKDANLIGDCGIAEARKNHYRPSVTTVLDVIAKPPIYRWREDLLIEEAFNISPIFADHEREEAKQCVIDRVAAKADAAPRLGTQWHDDISNFIRNYDGRGEYSPETAIPLQVLDALFNFLDSQEIEFVDVERKFCNGLWAGTIDYIGKRGDTDIIIDWKTQATKNGKVRFYDQMPMQLAAYANGIKKPDAELINVVLSTTEPPLIKAKTWGNNEVWFHAFYSAYELWKTIHNYNPYTGEKVFANE